MKKIMMKSRVVSLSLTVEKHKPECLSAASLIIASKVITFPIGAMFVDRKVYY
jgi:hypothetical protein